MVGLRQGRILTLLCVLFTSCSADVGLNTESSTVPDGVVYTDLKKNLIIGNPGVLPCRFYGGPVAVTWLKRTVPQTAPIQLVWHDGTTSGSKFEDGTYDMDDNYSLIIKDVKATETGRYICRVSNHREVLIQNYTDVTLLYDGLETKQEISLEKGFAGILPCKLNVRPKVVTWKKGPTYSSAKTIVAIDKYHNVDKNSGLGYEEGLFTITTDYSLVIVSVDTEDNGLFFCELLEDDTGTIFQDSTNVSVFESDDNTTVTRRNENCNCDPKRIRLYVISGVIIVVIVGVVIGITVNQSGGRCMHCVTYDPIPEDTPSRLTEDNLTEDPILGQTPSRLTEDNLTQGRISNVELWTLVVYSTKSKENDKLSEAIRKLTPGTHDIPTSGYGTCSTDYERNLAYFQSLCRWKKTCDGTEQMDTLLEACSQTKLGKTVKKLKDFRNNVSEGVSECDLEHLLWQIGKKSSENITTLLKRISKSIFDQEPSVPENVRRALPELKIWTEENLAINPAVMLSLQSDDLCDEDVYFCTVPKEDKRPLTDADIKRHARNVSKAHCLKIISIITAKGKSKRNKEENGVNRILDENEMDLFNTYLMIQEWLDEQKCSNYEKRITLRKAVEDAKEASTSNEINLREIEQLATSKENAEVAYELLMKDIKPFATNLKLDVKKFTNYDQSSSSSKSTRGTIGLVVDVRATKGKRIF